MSDFCNGKVVLEHLEPIDRFNPIKVILSKTYVEGNIAVNPEDMLRHLFQSGSIEHKTFTTIARSVMLDGLSFCLSDLNAKLLRSGAQGLHVLTNNTIKTIIVHCNDIERCAQGFMHEAEHEVANSFDPALSFPFLDVDRAVLLKCPHNEEQEESFDMHIMFEDILFNDGIAYQSKIGGCGLNEVRQLATFEAAALETTSKFASLLGIDVPEHQLLFERIKSIISSPTAAILTLPKALTRLNAQKHTKVIESRGLSDLYKQSLASYIKISKHMISCALVDNTNNHATSALVKVDRLFSNMEQLLTGDSALSAILSTVDVYVQDSLKVLMPLVEEIKISKGLDNNAVKFIEHMGMYCYAYTYTPSNQLNVITEEERVYVIRHDLLVEYFPLYVQMRADHVSDELLEISFAKLLAYYKYLEPGFQKLQESYFSSQSFCMSKPDLCRELTTFSDCPNPVYYGDLLEAYSLDRNFSSTTGDIFEVSSVLCAA